jgi:hypothetical protein
LFACDVSILPLCGIMSIVYSQEILHCEKTTAEITTDPR